MIKKRWMLASTLILAVGLTACDQNERSQNPPNDEMAPLLEEPVTETAADAAAKATYQVQKATKYAEMKTVEFSQWAQSQFNEAEPDIEKIQTKIADTSDSAAQQAADAWQSLKEKRQEVAANLEQLKAQGEDAGEDAKMALEQNINEFQAEFAQFKQEYKEQLQIEWAQDEGMKTNATSRPSN